MAEDVMITKLRTAAAFIQAVNDLNPMWYPQIEKILEENNRDPYIGDILTANNMIGDMGDQGFQARQFLGAANQTLSPSIPQVIRDAAINATKGILISDLPNMKLVALSLYSPFKDFINFNTLTDQLVKPRS